MKVHIEMVCRCDSKSNISHSRTLHPSVIHSHTHIHARACASSAVCVRVEISIIITTKFRTKSTRCTRTSTLRSHRHANGEDDDGGAPLLPAPRRPSKNDDGANPDPDDDDARGFDDEAGAGGAFAAACGNAHTPVLSTTGSLPFLRTRTCVSSRISSTSGSPSPQPLLSPTSTLNTRSPHAAFTPSS